MRTIAIGLSLMLVFLLPWENALIIPGVGTLTRVVGVAVAGMWLLAVLASGRIRRPHPFFFIAGLFCIWNAVSAFWSVDIASTRIRMITYAQLFTMSYLFWDLYTSRPLLNGALQAFVGGSYVAIGILIANYLTGNVTDWDQRVTVAGSNENDIGLILALGIPFAWHLFLRGRRNSSHRLRQFANLLYIPAALLGIALTVSRGGLLASLPGLVFVVAALSQLKFISRIVILIVLATLLCTLYPYIPQTALTRLSTIGSQFAEGDLGSRIDIWGQGLTVFTQHWLLGIGSGAFSTVVSKAAHNIYLAVAVDLGLIGLAQFLLMLAIIIYSSVQQPRPYALLWLAMLAVWGVGTLALSWEYRKVTWLLLSLVIIGEQKTPSLI